MQAQLYDGRSIRLDALDYLRPAKGQQRLLEPQQWLKETRLGQPTSVTGLPGLLRLGVPRGGWEVPSGVVLRDARLRSVGSRYVRVMLG